MKPKIELLSLNKYCKLIMSFIEKNMTILFGDTSHLRLNDFEIRSFGANIPLR